LDTIAAIATPPGRGGVGIVRISGPKAADIAQQLTPDLIWPVAPRHALLTHFCDHQQQRIDHGLLLHFPAPHSFTGEHVVEFQAHGGPIVLEWILQAALQAGARLARPGEFSEQAYLNDKFDLAQADIELAELQDRFAVALDLGGGGVHPQEFGGQLVDLIGAVGEAEGLGGFVQIDGGGEFGHLETAQR